MLILIYLPRGNTQIILKWKSARVTGQYFIEEGCAFSHKGQSFAADQNYVFSEIKLPLNQHGRNNTNLILVRIKFLTVI